MKNKKSKLIEEANKKLLSEDYGGNQFELPTNHLAAVKVPKGGSSCANCRYWDGKLCTNGYYKKWNGDGNIPVNPDEFCSDWWEPKI
jgi:hypothetical protein